MGGLVSRLRDIYYPIVITHDDVSEAIRTLTCSKFTIRLTASKFITDIYRIIKFPSNWIYYPYVRNCTSHLDYKKFLDTIQSSECLSIHDKIVNATAGAVLVTRHVWLPEEALISAISHRFF